MLTDLQPICDLEDSPPAGVSAPLLELPPIPTQIADPVPTLPVPDPSPPSPVRAAVPDIPFAPSPAVSAAQSAQVSVVLAAAGSAAVEESSATQHSSVSPTSELGVGISSRGGGLEHSDAQGAARVVCREQSLTLRGGDRVRLRLELVPQQPGILTVRGLRWTLSGTALGRRVFQPRVRKTAKCAFAPS